MYMLLYQRETLISVSVILITLLLAYGILTNLITRPPK